MHNISAPQISFAQNENSRFESMGLTSEAIEHAISSGLIQYKRSTRLHPVTHAGVTAWGEIVAAMREVLLSDTNGWDYIHQKGLSITHNKSKRISLIVTSGDKDTGLPDGEPKTKNKKGSSTRDIVTRNLDLFDSFNHYTLADIKADSTETWILLYHFDTRQKEVRFELSLPSNVSVFSGTEDQLRIDRWKDRILFVALPFDGVTSNIPLENIPRTEEVTFDISRKEQ
ncbi:MAG: hypothetical protein ACI9Y1_000791 [Lentisphaeria bacterium]|jgi:hypothetical protein